jgi:hypothetical protein
MCFETSVYSAMVSLSRNLLKLPAKGNEAKLEPEAKLFQTTDKIELEQHYL